ncbi:MAG: biopolymer transporter ExbD [Prevotella sp.]|nr:biopolymer transporter ExbD [Prevotella sp.]
MFRRRKRSVPELNTTSTADISFMLLIFFLVTTSMDTDKGLTRQLPPDNPMEEQIQESQIKEGMLLRLKIDAQGLLTCNDEPMSVKQLKARVMDFVARTGPEHVIQLEADRLASYDSYFNVQNEIVAAYNLLRDQKARKDYGYAFVQCSDEQKEKLRQAIPQRISEIYQTVEKREENRKEGAQ